VYVAANSITVWQASMLPSKEVCYQQLCPPGRWQQLMVHLMWPGLHVVHCAVLCCAVMCRDQWRDMTLRW
jgi:hypothetical protein